MEKKPAFGCHAINKFQMNFPNGNWLSTVWGPCTYSDNYDLEPPTNDEIVTMFKAPLWSNTVEIMFTCGDELRTKILEEYNDGIEDPIGYLPQNKWLEIVNLLANEKPE